MPSSGLIAVSSFVPPSGGIVVLDTMGRVVTRFVAKSEGSVADILLSNYRVLARTDGDSALIVAPRWYGSKYERWSLTGSRSRVLNPERPWFTPYDSAALHREVESGRVPPTRLQAVRSVADDRLVGIFVTPTPSGAMADTTRPVDEAFDSVIEVVDPQSGRVLKVVQVSPPLRGFVNDTLVYENVRVDDGRRVFIVYSLHFLGP